MSGAFLEADDDAFGGHGRSNGHVVRDGVSVESIRLGIPWRRRAQVAPAVGGLVEDSSSTQDGSRPQRIRALETVCGNSRTSGELAEVAARDLGLGMVERVHRRRHRWFLALDRHNRHSEYA